MFTSIWENQKTNSHRSRPARKRPLRHRPATRRLILEPLEDRRMLALGDLLTTLNNPTPAGNENFGQAVALAGNYVAVGAPSDDTLGSDFGAVYVLDAATGNLMHTLNNPNPTNTGFGRDGFGGAVGMSGNYVVVGSPGEDGLAYPLNYEQNTGRAYVFDAATGALLHTLFNPAVVQPPTFITFGAGFGSSVAVSGTRAVIGASYPGTTGSADQSGRAYLFDITTGALLRSFPNPTSSDEDRFGTSVAMDGNYVVIGASANDTGAANAGAAYLYDAATGALLRTFLNPTPAVNEAFGSTVAVSGSHVLIGSSGDNTAYLYDAATGALLQTFVDPAPKQGDAFGLRVALSENRVVVSGFERTGVIDGGPIAGYGTAYLFDAATGALLYSFSDPIPTNLDGFGSALALSDSRVVAGAPAWSVGAGRVRVFDAGSPLVVTTNADNGNDASPIAGSLRQAILLANSTPGLDVIDFNLAPGDRTINLAAGLPIITDTVIINGTTGTGGVPLIELRATGMGNGLHLAADNCLVRGLVINGFSDFGIILTSSGNIVEGNYIGTNAAGDAALGHGYTGVWILDSSYNRVEDNVISGTGAPGSVEGSGGAAVALLQLSGNVQGNTIARNKIGTSADGAALIPNLNGVFLGGGARDNVVENNLISGNTWAGVQIGGDVGIPQAFATSGNVVRGNTVTSNNDGIEVLAGPGLVFDVNTWEFTVPTLGLTNNTIQDNIVSGNREFGVVIDGIRADGNFVYDNTIQNNTSYGVAITGGAQGNTIGGAGALANTISGNGGGVLLRNLGTEFFPGFDFFTANHPDSPTGSSVVPVVNNAIRGNSIVNNTGLAIDLGGDGVTINDLGDADAGGPNGLQNFPVLLSAVATGGGLSVTGSFDGAPSTGGLVVDFYATPLPHASGFGGGATFLGSTTIATDASGRATFVATLPSVAVGQFVTSLVTSASGSTSEFSAAVRVAAEGSGVTPAEEDAAPNGGDGNDDGILDSLQDSVASLQDAVSGAYLTLESPEGTTLAAVQAVADPSTSGAPEGVDFPVGLVQFALTGVTPGSAQAVTLFLPAGVEVATYYKYGPTADDPSPHWYEFLYDGATGAELLSDRVVLHLVDGGRGDSDGLANGIIVDPGSPGVLTNTATTVTAPAVTYGDSVTVTANVSDLAPLAGTPTGSVQFYVDGVGFGSPVTLVNGAASISLPTPPAGAYSASAVYLSDDEDFEASTSPGAVAIVNLAPLTVTANDASRNYGAADPAFTVAYAGFVLGQDAGVLGGTVAFSTPATSASDVGSYALTPSGLTSTNYSITYVDGALSVTPAALTVTANDATRSAGEPNPSFTAGYAGFVLGQDASVLEGELILATAADAGSPPGNYPITPLGLSAENYDITFVSGVLHIVANVEIEVLRSDVNLASNGTIAVAIFTTADFDAATVNVSSVLFAGAHAVQSALGDADGDGDLDLLLHFRIAETNLRSIYEQLLADDLNGDGELDSNRQRVEVTLTGQTVDDVFVEGFNELDLFLAGKSLRQLLDELAAAGVI